MRRKTTQQWADVSAWGPLDECLLYSVGVVHDYLHNGLQAHASIPTTARLAPGERSLAVGPGSRLTWRALGDGSYTHSSMIAFGNVSFVAGSLIGNAVGNAARRRQAQEAAQPRWITDGPGEVTVTDLRTVFAHPRSPLDLGYDGLDTIDLVGPEAVACSFRDIHTGQHTVVQLQSPWASLIFVLAALRAFPAHPRLLSGGWLPPDFPARCHAAARSCPPLTLLQPHSSPTSGQPHSLENGDSAEDTHG
ncbi:hypothetical protein AB0B21_33185 [Streptomyces rimosus]|uniref:hypothetical protein n=1 Tax=Streptomyces rimosus TaxID=1927 RepID=UPI0018FED3BE|nr:hypothetical protein [Streptomyces rimosus]